VLPPAAHPRASTESRRGCGVRRAGSHWFHRAKHGRCLQPQNCLAPV